MKTQFIPDAFLISFPKAGRTWIRVMLAKLLQMGGGDPKELELIRYRHDGTGDLILHPSKERWKDNRIILLVRDPRDMIISFYFQVTLREKNKWKYEGSLQQFIRDPKYGIRNIVEFYNCWYKNKHIPKDFMIVCYEDMKSNPLKELQRMCEFFKITDEIKDINLGEVIEYSSFENMKQMDSGKKNHLLSNKGGFRTPGKNPERFKVRKGKVGGFTDYLEGDQLNYVNKIVKEMEPVYGY